MRASGWLAAAAALAVSLTAAAPALAQLPALRDRPLSAAERTRLTSLETQLARVSQQRSLSVNAVRAIAQALGERLTTQDPDQLIRAIDERAQELGAARGRISQLERDLEAMDSMRLAQAVGPMLTAANAAIEAGDLGHAESKLAEAAARFAEARQNLQGRVDDLALREADVLGQQAAVRAAAFDDLGASELYGRAAALIPVSDPNRRWTLLQRQGDSLFEAGARGADPEPLRRALAVLRDQALPLAPAATRGPQRLQTLRSLASLLSTLGPRAGDATSADEGLRIAREIATTTPREDADAWMLAQAQLGQSLATRGAGGGDLAMMREGVGLLATASEAALRDTSRPFRAGVHGAYVVALLQLAGFSDDAADYRRAADASGALAARLDRSAQARDWSRMQGFRGGALVELGKRTGSLADVQQGVAMQREALAAVPPADTLMARQGEINLARSLTALGELQGAGGSAALAESVALLRTVATPAFRAQSVEGWSFAQQNLALALLAQGRLSGEIAPLEEAAAVWRMLQASQPRDNAPQAWARAQLGIARALTLAAERASAADRATRTTTAREAWTAARDAATALQRTNDVAEAEAALGRLAG